MTPEQERAEFEQEWKAHRSAYRSDISHYEYRAIFRAATKAANALWRERLNSPEMVERVEIKIAERVRPMYLASYSYRDVAKAAIAALMEGE